MSSVPDFEQPLTVQTALQSIGRWVRVLPGDDLAIIIHVTGAGVLVRYASARLSHYATCSLAGLRLRTDCDGRLDPEWLRKAVAKHAHGTPDLANVVAYRLDETRPRPVDPEFVFEAYARERALGNPVDAIFDDVAALEARYQEQRELDAELDARVLADVYSPATGLHLTLGRRP